MAKEYTNDANGQSWANGSVIRISENKTYNGIAASYLANNDLHTLTVEPDVGTLAGTITFTVNGDPGQGNNVINLASDRVRNFQGRVPYIDFVVAGLPAGASFKLYII